LCKRNKGSRRIGELEYWRAGVMRFDIKGSWFSVLGSRVQGSRAFQPGAVNVESLNLGR
jgi:hypothetical protein